MNLLNIHTKDWDDVLLEVCKFSPIAARFSPNRSELRCNKNSYSRGGRDILLDSPLDDNFSLSSVTLCERYRISLSFVHFTSMVENGWKSWMFRILSMSSKIEILSNSFDVIFCQRSLDLFTWTQTSFLNAYIALSQYLPSDRSFVQACGLGLREKLGKPVSSSSDIGPISSYFVERFGFDEACRIIAFTGDNSGSLIGKSRAIRRSHGFCHR